MPSHIYRGFTILPKIKNAPIELDVSYHHSFNLYPRKIAGLVRKEIREEEEEDGEICFIGNFHENKKSKDSRANHVKISLVVTYDLRPT